MVPDVYLTVILKLLSGKFSTDATPTLLWNQLNKHSTDDDFGRRVQCTVSKMVIWHTELTFDILPEVGGTDCYARWLDNPGHQLISMVEVEIGVNIDRQYGDWMHIWNQLTLTSEQKTVSQR